MQNYNLKAMKNQAGMTLIELTVVLLVLIGLAGLTLPYVSGFIGKTHNSTSSASGSDLFSALSVYQSQNLAYPNNLNLLTTGAAASSTLATYLDNSFASVVTAGLGVPYAGIPTNFTALAIPTATGNYGATLPASAAVTLTNATNSQKQAGITKFAQLVAGNITPNADGTYTAGGTLSGGATFTPEYVNIATPAALVTDTANGLSGTGIAAVTPTNAAITGVTATGTIASALGYTVPAGHQLIVLGVGSANTAVGKSLASVPVHFGDKGSLQPTFTYSRFLAAVDVDTLNGTAPAKIVGIVHAPDTTDGWESVYSTIAGYYAN